jgi:hypothetical protein
MVRTWAKSAECEVATWPEMEQVEPRAVINRVLGPLRLQE